jgi:hypothetical protein
MAALTATAILAPAATAQASFVSLTPSSAYRIPPRSSVNYGAAPGEANKVTVGNGAAGALVIDDPGATITSLTPACVITNNAHTATCTPAESLAPTLSAQLGDGDDTFTNNATIPSENDVTQTNDQGQVIDVFDTQTTVFVSGGDGIDALTGSSAAEEFSGGLGDDTLRGNGGDDFLEDVDQTFEAPADREAGPGNDTIVGGPGDDFLSGGDGTDTVQGEAGDDSLFGGLGTDNLNGGDGLDGISYSLITFDANGDFVTTKPTDAGVSVVLDAAAATTTNGLAGENDTVAGVEDVDGTGGADSLTGSVASNVLRGGGGNDTIVGAAGNDNLQGQGDDDSINAQDAAIDAVDCGGGVGADKASVDNIDTVRGCGNATVTVTTVPPQEPVVIRDPADKKKAKISGLKAARKIKAKKFRKNGKYSVSLKPNEAVNGEFGLEAKAGGRALKTTGFVTLAAKKKTLAAAKKATIKLKVGKKLRRQLKKGKKLQLTIRLTDGGGNITTRKVKIKLT